MEYGSIEREFHVEASPEIVFDVVSSPEHIKQWWHADAQLHPTPGSTGELAWGDELTPRSHVSPITVVDADPPRLFSFRWLYSEGDAANTKNSTLVKFELVPAGEGTLVRLTETGFRELGWDLAVLEQSYNEHVAGWDTHLGGLREYLATLVAIG
jgi:uncharacterized protein YndB with AHSA1/START domain